MADKFTMTLCMHFLCIRMHICRRLVTGVGYGRVRLGSLRGRLAGFKGGRGAVGAMTLGMWLALAPVVF